MSEVPKIVQAKNISFDDDMSSELYKQATGSTQTTVQNQALLNVAGVAPVAKAFTDTLDWAVQQLADFQPKDAVESMLSQQMIAINSMAMACSKRALSEGQSIEMYDMNMRHAARLMSTFSKLSLALDKHRCKGQTIIVKHQQVSVEKGGQAVIGDVNL